MSTEMIMKMGIQGHLTIHGVRPDGSRFVISDKPNQITTLHLTNLAELMTMVPPLSPGSAVAFDAVQELAVNSMKIGANASPFPAPPSPSDTDILGTEVKNHIFDRVNDVSVDLGGTPGLIEFRASLDQSEGNGQTLREAGLFTAGDGAGGSERLVARQEYPAIVKTSDLGIEFTWRIQYQII